MTAPMNASWVLCSCGARLYIHIDTGTLAYRFQHGENPEHTSAPMPTSVDVTDNPDLQIAIEGYEVQDGVSAEFVAKTVTVSGKWIDAVHARAAL